MFRKTKTFSDELSSILSLKVQNLAVFSIIYMIRIRFFGPRELIERRFPDEQTVQEKEKKKHFLKKKQTMEKW